MELSPNAFGWMARELGRLAEGSARGRMALVLEGGYDLVALEVGLAGALDGMLRGRADAIVPTDDEAVGRAALWAKKAWSHVD